MKAGLEILEKLKASDEYGDFEKLFNQWIREKAGRVSAATRDSHGATFRRLDDSHYQIARMKPLRQYAARYC